MTVTSEQKLTDLIKTLAIYTQDKLFIGPASTTDEMVQK